MEIFPPPASSSPRLHLNHILMMDWANILHLFVRFSSPIGLADADS